MRVFRLLGRKSCLGTQRLRPITTSSTCSFSQFSVDAINRNNPPTCFLSQISADTINRNNRLLINHGDPYLEEYSSTNNGAKELEFKHRKNSCFPTESSLLQLYACGPCQGLVCVYSNFKYVSILDPATRDRKYFPFRREDFDEADVHFLGFGFDWKVKEFKIVRSTTFYDWGNWGVGEIHYIEIFSPNSMQPPREIPVVGEIRTLRPSCSGVPSVDGVCYWSAKDIYHVNMRVVSFNFVDEVFDVFTLPPCDYVNYNPHTEDCLMETFNGYPAAIRYDDAGYQDKFFEVWVKKKETWVKEMSIGPISNVIKPLCFLNKDGLVLLDSEYQLVLYAFATKQVKKLGIKLPKSIENDKGRNPLIQVLNLPGEVGTFSDGQE